MILARPKLRSRYEFYIWDGDDIVIDFVDGDDGGSPNPSLDNRYLWGPAVDQLLADEDYEYDAERAPAQAAQTTNPPSLSESPGGPQLIKEGACYIVFVGGSSGSAYYYSTWHAE